MAAKAAAVIIIVVAIITVLILFAYLAFNIYAKWVLKQINTNKRSSESFVLSPHTRFGQLFTAYHSQDKTAETDPEKAYATDRDIELSKKSGPSNAYAPGGRAFDDAESDLGAQSLWPIDEDLYVQPKETANEKLARMKKNNDIWKKRDEDKKRKEMEEKAYVPSFRGPWEYRGAGSQSGREMGREDARVDSGVEEGRERVRREVYS